MLFKYFIKKHFARYVAFVIIFIGTSYSNAQTKTLGQTEHDFAISMQTIGIKKAWLFYLDSNSVRFNKNNQPENAFLYWCKNERPGTFNWNPQITEVSKSGNFGYTTGPIAYYKNMNVRDTPVFMGGYISIWRRNNKGDWKTIFDVGTGYPVNTIVVAKEQLISNTSASFKKRGNKISLLKKEKAFSKEGKSLIQYRTAVSKEFLLFAEGGKMISKIDSLESYIKILPYFREYSILGIEISDSGDLGYVYGTYKKKNGNGIILRIWRRERSSWKIALEYIR